MTENNQNLPEVKEDQPMPEKFEPHLPMPHVEHLPANVENTETDEGASFAELLAAQEETPAPRLEVGQRVKAAIVHITDDTIFVSTGSKVDGLVDRAELEQDGIKEYAVGDTLDLHVVHASAHEVRLSRYGRGSGNLASLEAAKESGLPIDGKVSGVVKGGFSVDILKRRAFCPVSQIDLRPVENPEELIGKTLSFKVMRVEKGGRNIVLSRRALLEAQQNEGREAFLAGVNVGDVLEASVVRLAPFGIFVELAPGVEGMVHVSELSWSRVQQPEEVCAVGDTLRVKVLSLGQGEKGPRISLSVRQVTENPWQNVGGRLNAGDVVSGKVLRTTQFGAFVEVLPGIEGLIHISELSYEKRVNKVSDVLVVGDVVTVKIKELDLDKKRVSLSLRDVAGDPWDKVEDSFAPGAEVTGRLERRAPFGLFISLAPGVTALLPNSALPQGNGRAKFDKMAPGTEFTVKIGEINLADKKISLTLTEAEQAEFAGQVEARADKDPKRARSGQREGRSAEEKDWKKHAPKAAEGFGSLGNILQAAIQKKK